MEQAINSDMGKKKKKKASFEDIFDIFKGLENRRGRGVGEKCCFILSL